MRRTSFACLISLVFSASLRAQIQPLVSSVQVEGTALEKARAYIVIDAGTPLDEERVRETVILLAATDRYDDIRVDTEPDANNSLRVRVRVREAPFLGETIFRMDDHNDALNSLRKEALRSAGLRVGEPLREVRLRDIEARIQTSLRSKGYPKVEVSAALQDPNHAGEGATLIVAFSRAAKELVRSARVDGWPNGVSPPQLPKIGASVTDESKKEWEEDLKAALRERGYLRASLRTESVGGDIVFFVNAGTPMAIRLKGLSPKDAAKHQKAFARNGYTQETVEDATAALEEKFRREGFREAEVAITESLEAGKAIAELAPKLGDVWKIAAIETEGDGPVVTPATVGMTLGSPWVDADVAAARASVLQGLVEKGHARADVRTVARGTPDQASLVFQISQGPAFRIEKVDLVGFPDVKADDTGRATELLTRPGRPFRRTAVLADRLTLLTRLRDLGFLDAIVEPAVDFADETGLARVTFRASPGPRISVDRIVLSGISRTKDSVVLRESRLREGDWLSFQKLLDTQAGLASTGLFSNATVREIATSDTSRTLVIEAQEAPSLTLVPGVGYGERDSFRGSLDISKRNVSGLGRTASLFLRGSQSGSRALLSFTEPYAFGRRQAVAFQTFTELDRRDAFSFKRFGGQIQTLFPLTKSSNLLLQLTVQRTNTFNVKTDCGEIDRSLCDGRIAGPVISFLRDTRDDALDPRRGQFIELETQASLPAFGGDAFLKASLSAARYDEIRRGFVVAAGARLGAARAVYGSQNLPVSERFFGGGANSLRGFKTDRLGPLRLNGEGTLVPVGGNALATLGIEARVDLPHRFGIQLFAETGNVFAGVHDVRRQDFREVIGGGLRWLSPGGPVRAEYAWRVDRKKGEPRGEFHIGVGYAF